MGAVDDMQGRVAELWRSQGEGFLERHHALVIDDVARLRGAVVIGEDVVDDDGAADWHDKMSAAFTRMKGWDEAVMERLRRNREEELVGQAEWEAARNSEAIVDLTGPEPVVTVAEPVALTAEELATTCKHCEQRFDVERLVYPHGERKPPLCIPCAREIAGLRPRARSRA